VLLATTGSLVVTTTTLRRLTYRGTSGCIYSHRVIRSATTHLHAELLEVLASRLACHQLELVTATTIGGRLTSGAIYGDE
jgi:hypothetical protein